jgi:acyl-CoA thioester hydrolase
LAAVGHGPEVFAATGHGWADARHIIEYRRELKAESLLRVSSGIVRVGRTSLTYRHLMHGVPDAAEHATMEVVTVFFDLAARAAVPLPEAVRTAAQGLIVGTPS